MPVSDFFFIPDSLRVQPAVRVILNVCCFLLVIQARVGIPD